MTPRWMLACGLLSYGMLTGGLWSKPVAAAETLVLDRHDLSWPLGTHADLWLDDDGEAKSLDEALTKATWTPVDAPRKTLRLGRGVLWLRVKVRDGRALEMRARTPDFRVEFAHPRPIELLAWVPRQGRRVEVHAGLDTPLAEREVPSRSVVVPFEPGTADDDTLYFRIDSTPLGFSAVITSGEESARRDARESWLLGLYYGVALGLLAYNLFLWLSLRQSTYGWYLVFLVTSVAFFAARNGYIWAAGWTPSSGFGGGAMMALQVLAALSFARGLWNTKEFTPLLDRAIRAVQGLASAMIVLTAAWPSKTTETAVAPLVLATLILLLAASAVAARKGNRRAQIFLAAWGLYLAGGLLYVLKSIGVVAHNVVTEHAMQVGSALEMSLLSLALADRIRSLERAGRTREHRLALLQARHEGELHRLREASALRVIAAQDEHSRRLARDLHDSIGHRFLILERIAQEQAGCSPEERWLEIAALAQEGIEETRELAHGLYPQRLIDLGLEAALQAAAEAVQKVGLPMQTRIDEGLSQRLAADARLTALRVAEEALQNAMRHAEANHISMTWQLAPARTHAVLEINDDGKGDFVVGEREGLGLRTMRDRAFQVRGTLDIEPRPGAGTRVRLLLPLGGDVPSESVPSADVAPSDGHERA